MSQFKQFLISSLLIILSVLSASASSTAQTGSRTPCPGRIFGLSAFVCSRDFIDDGFCVFSGTGDDAEQTWVGNLCGTCPDGATYEKGQCKGKMVNCDGYAFATNCSLDYEPVCGYTSQLLSEHRYAKAFLNPCVACDQSMVNIDYFIRGLCPGQTNPFMTECDQDNRPEECDSTESYVCANIKDCVDDACVETKLNGCEACQDSNILSYTPGRCRLSN